MKWYTAKLTPTNGSTWLLLQSFPDKQTAILTALRAAKKWKPRPSSIECKITEHAIAEAQYIETEVYAETIKKRTKK
jgi:hypothetical protein